jgi:CBS domain containing-hemolysin-like protein
VLRLARQVDTEHPRDGSPVAIIGATSKAAEMTVAEIMVPRTEIVAFPAQINPSELLEQMLEERYTRVPIYEESIDRILGIVHPKDLIKLIPEEREVDLRSLLKPVIRVPGRKPILSLLADMQHAFCHVAIVKDEFGVTQGMVTQEDILEEIVGEIRDEFDREELLTIHQIADNKYEAWGRLRARLQPGDGLERARRERRHDRGTDLPLPGARPRKGEEIDLPGYVLRVIDLSGSRITRVHIEAKEVEEEPERSGSPLTLLR